jgi:hypothetical protein
MNQLVVSALVLLSSTLYVQAQEDLIKGLKTGFKTGNVKEISPYLGQRTEIAFDSEKTSYDKEKTEQTLSKFLVDAKPKDFQMLHQGASKEGIKFYIGELTSDLGTYRILIYLKKNESRNLIESIDISKE